MSVVWIGRRRPQPLSRSRRVHDKVSFKPVDRNTNYKLSACLREMMCRLLLTISRAGESSLQDDAPRERKKSFRLTALNSGDWILKATVINFSCALLVAYLTICSLGLGSNLRHQFSRSLQNPKARDLERSCPNICRRIHSNNAKEGVEMLLIVEPTNEFSKAWC